MDKLKFVLYNKEALNHYDAFLEMLSDYFDEICFDKPEDNIPKKYLPKILDTVSDETKEYSIWAYLCFNGNEPIGFAIAQIDTKENPLCKKETWGFIREFYIIPVCRRNGCAKQLCEFIENVIYTNGANDIYLTASEKDGVPFWESMGYIYSGKIDDKNGHRIYEKYFAK